MPTKAALLAVLMLVILASGCTSTGPAPEPVDRYANIPADAVKMTPELDKHPPILHSEEYEQPVPLAVISSRGAEDSPFIPIDGSSLYFVYVPDVSVPVEKQVLDKTIGIWVSEKVNGGWTEPEKVILQDPSKLSLDGCEFVEGDRMWFCTAREGYTGLHWFSAERIEGRWQNWKRESSQFPDSYEVGELHFTKDWTELYFHSSRPGGKGGTDIWKTTLVNNSWTEPVNIEAANTPDNEGMPYITPDGQELWFNRWYLGSPAVFRSKLVDGEWQEAELIVSQFAGEPTLDREGNVYFVHHYYEDGVMIEADIYIAYRK